MRIGSHAVARIPLELLSRDLPIYTPRARGEDSGMEKPPCPECQKPMAERKGKFGPFWGCSQYPRCCGMRSQNGKARPPSQPPARRDQAKREADNRAAVAKLAAMDYMDGQPCPFDDVPGANDIRTAFGRTGGELSVVEMELVCELDSEFAEMFR
jgi:hypothetical protein